MKNKVSDKVKTGLLTRVRSEKLKQKRKQGVQIDPRNNFQFAQRCLDPDDPMCNSDEFFKEISYLIDLNVLAITLTACLIFQYLLKQWLLKLLKNTMETDPLLNWAICDRYLLAIFDKSENEIKHLAFKKDILYASSETKLAIVQLPQDILSSPQDIYEVPAQTIRFITPSCRILSLILSNQFEKDSSIMIALETPDNQLDYYSLYCENLDQSQSDFKFSMKQIRFVTPKLNNEGRNRDPIKKVCQVFSNDYLYSMALKESGHVDIYWNMQIRDSPQDITCVDIGMSLIAFYFQLQDGSYRYLKHLNQSNLSFSMSEKINEEEVDWENLQIKRIQDKIKLYTGYKIMKTDKTYIIISHDRFVSIYSIEDQKWVNHIYYPSEVFSIQRTYNNNYHIILRSGEIFTDFQDNYDNQEQTATFKIGQPILRIHEDKKLGQGYILISSADNRLHKATWIQKDKMFDSIVPFTGKTLNLVFVQNNDSYYLILQKDSSLILYQCESSDDSKLTEVKTFSSGFIMGQHIHSALSYDINDHLFVFTNQSLLIIRFKEDNQSDVQLFKNFTCQGVQFFTKSISYALCTDSPTALYPGLRFFDMESMLNKGHTQMLLVKDMDVALQAQIDFNQEVGRLAFQRGMSQLIVTPLLHQSANQLMGAKEKDLYVCFKVEGDRFIALKDNGQILTWNLVNGKQICTFMNADFQKFSDYTQIYQYENLAIMYCNKVVEQSDDQFFESWQLNTYSDFQIPYLKHQKHDFRLFKVLEIKNEQEINVLMTFTFPLYQTYQKIYINSARDRLILRLSNFRTFLYQIDPLRRQQSYNMIQTPQVGIINEEQINQVQLTLIRQIQDFPEELDISGLGSIKNVLMFFSPCFSRYMLLNKGTGEFYIKDALSDQIIGYIPKDLLFFDKKVDENPSIVINRIKWVDISILLIINKEGFEKIVNIDLQFKEIAYNYRPFFKESDLNNEVIHCPYYFQRPTYSQEVVKERLKRKYQSYKTDMYIFQKKTFSQFYESLISVDRDQLHLYDHSFTFLHWSLIEQILQKKLLLQNLDPQVLESLVYSILPGGNTILHMLALKDKFITQIFESIRNSAEIPFLPNIHTIETPLHLLLDKRDYRSVNEVLKYLKIYPVDHHSRGIKNRMSEIIYSGVSSIGEYLDSRVQQTEQMKKLNKAKLKKDCKEIVASDIWFNSDNIAKEIVDTDQLETRIQCEVIDMPQIYHYLDDEFQEFFDQLANSQIQTIFENKVIQKLIDFNYPLAKTFIIAFLFVPFLLYHLLFVLWANAVYEFRYINDNYHQANLACSIVLLIFSAYFMSNEVRQFSREGLGYVISIWNYIDLIAPIGVIYTQIMVLVEHKENEVNQEMFRSVFAITTLFMWIKLLYFLRIFKQTGYLIRMIVEVLKDMGIFLLVLLITVTAFGDAFLRLSLANDADQQFITVSPSFELTDNDFEDTGIAKSTRTLFLFAVSYTYRGILGDFDTSAFGTVVPQLVWILWFFHTLFNMIVMLNLLISIIGDTYSRVISSQQQAAYSEMACLISENQHLIPLYFKQNYAKQNGCLMTVQNLEKYKEDVFIDPVQENLQELRNQISEIKSSVESQGDKLDAILSKLKQAFPEQ